MQRYRTFFIPRLLTNNRYRYLSIFVFSIVICLLIIYTPRTPISLNPHRAFSYIQSLDLLRQEKILIPVHINQLYQYRVVCADSKGTLDRSDLITQLSKTCQIPFNGSVNVQRHPPADFQVRSSVESTSIKLWQSTKTCSLLQNETIAIVISYRDREENLRTLLYNLIPFLSRQQISNYAIFIVEQQTAGAFNKGRLYNVAFAHLMKTYQPTCVIFHDVDLIPENDQNIYSCAHLTDHPLHMSANVRSHINGSYSTIYPFLVGGVVAIRPRTFTLLNGYSNEYFNWGGEDDDMGIRFLSKDICVQRPTNGYYYATSHSIQKRNENRFKLLFDATLRQDIDGLSNIDRLAVVAHVEKYPLVTWITVKWTANDSSIS